MRRWLSVLALAVLTAGSALVTPQAAQADPYCGIEWGSLDKSVAGHPAPQRPIENVRAGRHACFNRLVIDIDGRATAYRVRYVSAVTRPGSGKALLLRGGHALQIEVKSGTRDADTGARTYRPADPDELVHVGGWQTFRQVALAGSFEGVTTFGLCVRARLPFRVLSLDDPGRLVIDVAHQW